MHGGQIFRFVDELQLSFPLPAEVEPLPVGDDEVFVTPPRSADDEFNLQCMIESVGESGLVLVEILDSKEARKASLQGERLKVPLRRLSRTQRPYYVEDEDTKQVSFTVTTGKLKGGTRSRWT